MIYLLIIVVGFHVSFRPQGQHIFQFVLVIAIVEQEYHSIVVDVTDYSADALVDCSHCV